MRILRGLSSQLLPCGCLVGVYETYSGEVIGIIDARGPSCAETTHETGKVLPVNARNRPDFSAPASDPE